MVRRLTVLVVLLPLLFACRVDPETFAVTYHGNGHDGGTVPVDDQRYTMGQEFTVRANTGGLTNEPYLFNRWNSRPDGNGTIYTPGHTHPIGPGDLHLYAKWSPFEFSSATAAEENWWRSVTWGNGLFVAVAGDGDNPVMTSDDGISWTEREAPEGDWWSVTWGNGLFVAVASSGTPRVMTSPDGISWTAREAAEANTWFSVTYGNGLFVSVAVDGANRVMYAPWTP